MYVEESPRTTNDFSPFSEEYGASQLSDAVLDGTVNLEEYNLTTEMKFFLEKLKQTEEEKTLSVPSRMTAEEFSDGLKNTPEQTSSSPLGIHYMLWKAISEDDDLCETHSLWLSLPFMYGFICERW